MHLFLVGLAVLFIALKLTGVIAWSWFLVLLPAFFILLIPLLIFAFLAFIAFFA